MNLSLRTIACVDASSASPDVCDWAAWAAKRLDTPLELLHVLERRPELAPLADFSGTLSMDVHEDLLQNLAGIDEQRSKLAQEHGRLLLQQLRARLASAGLLQVTQRQRHGDLSESLLDLQDQARLFVLGRHTRNTGSGKLHLDHHLERAIRSVARPVLMATGSYSEPQRFMVAVRQQHDRAQHGAAHRLEPAAQGAGLPCGAGLQQRHKHRTGSRLGARDAASCRL
jgi:nucleotide-binding universal stress UspA family protein